MGSTAPDTFGSQQEGQPYPVKAEYSVYEDQQQLHSSEEEYSGAGEQNRLSQAHDGEQFADSDTHLGFQETGFDQSTASATASSTSMPTKDPIPISKRTLQNRKAQREFRQRRATYLKDLEAKVRRFEAGEPAGVHPEVHHRINHLVQEIQYLRTIVDRLQQENAELRRADSGYSGHQALPPGAGQAAYTLHPPYPPSTSTERCPDTYGSSSLALAEMFQPGYQASSFASRPHLDVETSRSAYPLHSPASAAHAIHNFPSESPRAPLTYQTHQMDWSAMRQSSGSDRPRTATLDTSRPGPNPLSDHDGSDPTPAYLYQGSNQSSYYHPSNHTPSGQRDSSGHNPILPNPHTTSPSSAEPQAAGGIGNPYAQYGHGLAHNQRTSQGLGVPDSAPSWQPHNSNSSNVGFHASGPVQHESIEYSYHPTSHHPQSSLQEPSRSSTHSPALGSRNHSGAVPT